MRRRQQVEKGRAKRQKDNRFPDGPCEGKSKQKKRHTCCRETVEMKRACLYGKMASGADHRRTGDPVREIPFSFHWSDSTHKHSVTQNGSLV